MEEETDPEGLKLLRQAGRLTAVGLEMGIAVAIGIFGGKFLDSKFETDPLFFWIGLVLGFGAAGNALYFATKVARQNMENNGTPPSKKH